MTTGQSLHNTEYPLKNRTDLTRERRNRIDSSELFNHYLYLISSRDSEQTYHLRSDIGDVCIFSNRIAAKNCMVGDKGIGELINAVGEK